MVHAGIPTPPRSPMDRMTDTCKNKSSQTMFAGGNKYNKSPCTASSFLILFSSPASNLTVTGKAYLRSRTPYILHLLLHTYFSREQKSTSRSELFIVKKIEKKRLRAFVCTGSSQTSIFFQITSQKCLPARIEYFVE